MSRSRIFQAPARRRAGNGDADHLARVGYADLRARISRARSMDVAALNDGQVYERVRFMLDGYATMLLPLQMSGVFRARKNSGETLFTAVSELWYPPAAVARWGRFNETGQPVFYACNRAHGAAFEVHPSPGDLITLLVARTKSPMAQILCAQIGLERCLAPGLSRLKERGLPRSRDRFQAFLKRRGITKRWLLIDDFLSDMATASWPAAEEANKYKITNAMARLLSTAPVLRR